LLSNSGFLSLEFGSSMFSWFLISHSIEFICLGFILYVLHLNHANSQISLNFRWYWDSAIQYIQPFAFASKSDKISKIISLKSIVCPVNN
jgi:hypothetical protein